MNKEEVELKNKLVNVLWCAFLVATLVYFFVVFYLQHSNIGSFQFTPVISTLSSIGIINIIIGFGISNKIRSILGRNPHQDLDSLYSKFITLNIIAWALIESAAALGLVAAILEKNAIYFLTLAIPSFLALFLSRPRPEVLKSIILGQK